MRVFSANRLRALVLISEIAAAEKGWSRKARHWPAPDRSKTFAACFGNGRFLGKTSNRHFLAKSSHLWFSFSEATRANGPEGGVACPVESQLSSSRPESTFNPLRNLHSRKEKAFGFCCAGLGFRCGGLGFWCLRLGFCRLRLGNPSVPASRPSAASPCLDKGGSAIHIPSIRHPYGCGQFRNLAIAEAAR